MIQYAISSQKRRRAGFTLVELSVVLLIIALIAGGILVGRDLIYLSQVRAQVAQLDQYDAAVYTFQQKYNCLPGDCAFAVELNLGVSGGDGDNGDGSGWVDNALTSDKIMGYEIAGFWYHLKQAGLLDSAVNYNSTQIIPGRDTPELKLPGRGAVGTGGQFHSAGGVTLLAHKFLTFKQLDRRNHAWMLGARDRGDPGTYLAVDLHALDMKIDDGKHDTGIFRVTNTAIATPLNLPVTTALQPASCAKADGTYNLTSTDSAATMALCAAVIDTKF